MARTAPASPSGDRETALVAWQGNLSRARLHAWVAGLGALSVLSCAAVLSRVASTQSEPVGPVLAAVLCSPFLTLWVVLAVAFLRVRVVLTATSLTWRLPFRGRRTVALADVDAVVVAPVTVLGTEADVAWIHDRTRPAPERFDAVSFFDRPDVLAVLGSAGIPVTRGAHTEDAGPGRTGTGRT